MEIKVLGTGCPKCHKLEAETRAVAKEMGLDCTIEKVDQVQDIMAYGVMLTPALVVDGAVKVVGKVPSNDELKQLLS
ncbi:MAG: thioredoxin family protein [bacterium]|nr:thioredoxin family protein [bacterium]